jgi:hypothetical protein
MGFTSMSFVLYFGKRMMLRSRVVCGVGEIEAALLMVLMMSLLGAQVGVGKCKSGFKGGGEHKWPKKLR